MPVNLAEQFLETGLLHFGLLQNGADKVPFRFEFDYLPAYPDVLRNCVSEAQSYLKNLKIDRLLATTDSLPLGVALSLATNISLVYSRGEGEAPVHDLVGAYNSGHHALLLTNIFSDFHSLNPLITDATRVGLEIQGVVVLVDLGIENLPPERPLYKIARLADLVNDLRAAHLLPTGQAQAVLDWIDREAANLRLTAVAP